MELLTVEMVSDAPGPCGGKLDIPSFIIKVGFSLCIKSILSVLPDRILDCQHSTSREKISHEHL